VGASYTNGYGMFNVSTGHPVPAHRFSYALAHGAIPVGLSVLHRCDVPKCIRPDHLWLGTHTENMAEMVAKGRSTFGERNAGAKLTGAQVGAIRQRWSEGVTQTQLATEYDVSQSLISLLVRGVRWRHLKPASD
jgi:hypothetical protein